MVSDPLSERGTVRGGKGGAEHDFCTPVVSQAVREAYRTVCRAGSAAVLAWVLQRVWLPFWRQGNREKEGTAFSALDSAHFTIALAGKLLDRPLFGTVETYGT